MKVLNYTPINTPSLDLITLNSNKSYFLVNAKDTCINLKHQYFFEIKSLNVY